MAKNKVYKSPKTFHIFEDDSYLTVNVGFFDQIEDRSQALSIAVSQYIQLNKVLLEEALIDDELYVGPMKLTNGLKRTIDELSHRFPFLMEEVFAVNRRFSGQRLACC